MLTTKGRARLLRLAEFLSKRRSHFNMCSWFSHDGDHEHDIGGVLTVKALQHCGTAACALGWAATMPFAKKDGVAYRPGGGFYVENRQVFASQVSRHLFGLDNYQHCELFENWEAGKELDPKAWAKRCRALIKQWEAK